MVDISFVKVQVSGDIGGLGISKFGFQRVDATPPLQSDCNSAGAAVHGLLTAVRAVWPLDITWTILGECDLVDHATGAPAGIVTMSSVPAAVTGASAGAYGAGLGLRMNWKTPSVHGRRYIRGCTFFVPTTRDAFGSNGAADPSTQASYASAGAAYIAAMAAANLDPIVWHRPPKGTTSGGAVGLITSAACSSVPAGLRSRRS